jgi:hypothetical protein
MREKNCVFLGCGIPARGRKNSATMPWKKFLKKDEKGA